MFLRIVIQIDFNSFFALMLVQQKFSLIGGPVAPLIGRVHDRMDVQSSSEATLAVATYCSPVMMF